MLALMIMEMVPIGVGVNLQQVLIKLESVYGDIESKEVILRSLYNCTQKPNESV